jgi:hypothetical protein
VITSRKLAAAIGLVGFLGSTCLGGAQAFVIFTEGFDGPVPPPGWTIDNSNSTAGGTTTWFKGDDNVFVAQSGASDSYAAANFLNTGFGGNIRDWLIMPTLSLINGDVLDFWTRTETGSTFGDQLSVRMCRNAACTLPFTTANFSTVLVPTFTVPDSWTHVAATISGLSQGDTARIAFGYICNDTSVNCDYIGIDSVGIDSVRVVPEPSALLLLALGLATLGWHLRRSVVR